MSTRFTATLTLLITAGMALAYNARREPDAPAAPLSTLDIPGWNHTATQHVDPATLRRKAATELIARTYRQSGKEVGLFVEYFANQRSGETMHSPKNCLPGSGWEIWKQEKITVLSGGVSMPVNKLYVQNSGRRVVLYYWYQSRAGVFANEYFGKLLLMKEALMGGRTAGAFVRVVADDTSDSEEQVLAFCSRVMPAVSGFFRR